MDLVKGKIVFITGGTRGIGFAAAKKFIENGAHVAIAGHCQETVDAALAKLKELYQHEMDYLSSLTELTAGQKGGVPAAGEAPAPEPVQEPEQEDDRPGGLYSDITATFLSEDGKTERKIKVDPERRAAEMAASAPQPDPQPKEELLPEEEEDDEPTKRLTIDLEHLQFGKDYEIK